MYAAAGPVEADSIPDIDPKNPSARQSVQAFRAPGHIVIDGVLDDPAWAMAVPVDSFRQREPVEGAPPTERTVVRVLYDDQAIYIGAHMFDSSPDSIVARLGRRDAELDSDLFAVFIDPYLDRRTGFYFGVNPAGTMLDGVLYNDSWDDDSWDGVWRAETRIDETGWIAEMRIPYSQLRFHQQSEYTWGINFRRDIKRKNEQDFLVFIPKNESGFVSRFADLVGMRDIAPPRQVEIVPYLRTRAEYTQQDAANPFNDGSRYVPGFGGDLKIGLTSNFTLNATVNPDFGQVEVDPAVVNLSDFETFFPEKRPFFIEGSTLFNSFGFGGSNSHWGFNFGTPDFFYSRRVGRAPQGGLPDNDYNNMPDGSRILGAAKLTGKASGWNLGAMQAVTAREVAELTFNGSKDRVEVEPLTYYGVFRGQKEIDEGRQGIGFISTIASRRFGSEGIREYVNSGSYVAGMDGWTFLDPNKTWVITGWAGLSHVTGSPERMTALQQSSLHYFQRPDADHVELDSNATSMTGWAGRLLLNKQRGNVMLNTAIGIVSPSFDINDVGFMFTTDVINAHFGIGYRWTEPTRLFRDATVIGAAFQNMNFGGDRTSLGVWSLVTARMLNYYRIEWVTSANPEVKDHNLTRGGPLAARPRYFGTEMYLNSDDRKPWVLGLQGGLSRSPGGDFNFVGGSIQWKPATNFNLSINPQFSWNFEDAQWVDAFDDPTATATYGKRYVFGEMDQRTLSSSIRLNWTFTPELSFQLFAQPLISTADFKKYKEFTRPGGYEFRVFGEGGSTFDDETLVADPDGDGPAAPIQLEDQDFTFKSLRGTAVLRWEYRPGSTLYLVWTQSRTDDFHDREFRVGRSLERLWEARPDNIFMIKLTYWFGR